MIDSTNALKNILASRLSLNLKLRALETKIKETKKLINESRLDQEIRELEKHGVQS